VTRRPRRVDGNARLRNRSRARTPRRFRHPEVAPDAPILHQPQNRYAASDATSVHDRGNMTTLLGLLKNPALALRVDTGPPLAGCLLTGRLEDGGLHSTVSRTAKLLSGRPVDGHDFSPASCDARAVSKTHCAFLTRYALRARTKQCGLASRSTGLKTQLYGYSPCCNAASSRTCLHRPRWATRDASSLHKRENHNLRCRRLIPRNGGEKRGAFGISSRPHGGPLGPG